MSPSQDDKNDREEQSMVAEDNRADLKCPECGTEAPEGAKFCANCAAPITATDDRKSRKAARKAFKKKTRGEPKPIEPWALKAGDTMGKVPRWVKIWVPIVILLVIVVVAGLLVVAGGHTPQAAIERYLDSLQSGRYKTAYDMTLRQGGKFGTFDYFSNWQLLQNETLGRLESFSVSKLDLSSRLLGRLVQPEPSNGEAYVATLNYKEKSYDVKIFAVDDGGSWPAQSFKIKLSEGPTAAIVAPLGASISIDGMAVGRSEENKDLKEALMLGHFPKDFNSAVDYVRALLRTAENSVINVRSILTEIDRVAQDVQGTLERLNTGSVSWQQILDAGDQVVSQSRGLASDIARDAIHVYWIFGGGDDGTVRARYTRVEPGLEFANLPEGWHQIRVTLSGMEPQTKEFYAPETATVTLDPTTGTEDDYKAVVQNYLKARVVSFSTLNPTPLFATSGGTLLDADLAHVSDLAATGTHQVSQLVSLKFTNFKVLTPDVATVDTEETWNYTVFKGSTPTSVLTNQKTKVVYTLRLGSDGRFKAIESKTK